MSDPIRMTVQRAKEILEFSSNWLGHNGKIPFPISAEEVQALSQAFVDLTMANEMLEITIEAVEGNWEEESRAVQLLHDNAAGEVL